MLWIGKPLPDKREATATGLVAAGAVLILNFAGHIDILPFGIQLIAYLKPDRVDDFVFALVLVFTGFLIDSKRAAIRARQEAQIQANRLRVLKATMRSVQDIVHNFINDMQLIELEAGDALADETIDQLATIRDEAVHRLALLAELDSTPETETMFGTAIDYNAHAPSPNEASLAKSPR